jgi:hypothetical protein
VHTFPSSAHEVPLGRFASAEQLGPVPGQKSSASHSPAALRQIAVTGSKPSAGHVVLVPSHDSATSQTPATPRQRAPAFPAGCWQSSLLPSH